MMCYLLRQAGPHLDRLLQLEGLLREPHHLVADAVLVVDGFDVHIGLRQALHQNVPKLVHTEFAALQNKYGESS